MSRRFKMRNIFVLFICIGLVFIQCKKEEENNDTAVLALLLANQSGVSCVSSGVSIAVTIPTTSEQSVNYTTSGSSKIGFVVAKGLKNGDKVVFTELAGSNPGTPYKTCTDLNPFSPGDKAYTANTDFTQVGPTSNVVTYTIITPGDYYFYSITTGSPKVKLQ